jgi:pimeloyl-ACP methyl ester carboxylesterase
MRLPLLVAIGAALLAACADQTRTSARPLSAAPDRVFTNGDVRLRYREGGVRRGIPVVFIHGYTRSLEDWFALADSFSTDHRVVAFDVRGFGKSSKFGEPARFGAKLGDDVVALLDHLGIERAHLIGHSMGALIAANVALRYPKRVASAALISPPFWPDSATHAREGAQWVRDMKQGVGMRNFLPWLFPGMPDSVARQLSTETMMQNDSASMVASMQGMGGLAVAPDRISQSSVPVFIAVGGADPLAPLSRYLAQRWPSSRYLEVAGADHITIMAKPEVFAGMRAIVR